MAATNDASDSEELLDTTESDKAATEAVQSEENDALLDEIEHSLNKDEKTEYPFSANIANKQWQLQKLGDEHNLKRNLKNITTLQTEQVTKIGHIILKSTEHLLQAKADSSKLCLDDLVRMNTDALALLGHVCFEITH
ncbi:Hypothetical predicted protein [Paramuricea clavata]|uniref:Uncharacterized protein n=1 Tax=Paramuricea clavata TaxID=317549 RepID=A0A6S7G3T6_PARCT|nr:Hypothetical predicted protein [Paramuricea clavata]